MSGGVARPDVSLGSRAIRTAAIMYVALGVGFGIGAAIALDHHRREGELPMTPWGFRALAGGPFDDLTPEQFTVLGSALVGVCALNVVAGMWLWQGHRRGATLGLATSPAALALGVGFALPFLLAGVPISVALNRGWTPNPPIEDHESTGGGCQSPQAGLYVEPAVRAVDADAP